MEQNSLYDRPVLYDLMVPRDPILERFYVGTARERGGRVLDPACGSGRLTIPLAQAGLEVVGGDLSPEMLARARRHAIEETASYDPLAQIRHVEWYWSRETEKDFWKVPLRMRCIFPQEMPMLIASGGLRLIARFGEFDRSPLAAGSRRQICVCGLTPAS